jgi:predicted amino acid racemase
MTAPRLEIDLGAIAHNARHLVDLLSRKGIRVQGVTKATLGSPGVAAAMISGGVTELGDSRVENLARLRRAGVTQPLTLIRSPMLSQADRTVSEAGVSHNTEPVVLEALSLAAVRQGTTHSVILMVELGDLREGVAVDEVVDLALRVGRMAGLRLAGLGGNLACQSGVVPDARNMAVLSRLADDVEAACGHPLSVVSGGNSANLGWALAADDVGRIDQLRLGEAILLGTEPLDRKPIPGLRTDAFTLYAEVIEVQLKPAQPWGDIAQAAFGEPAARSGTRPIRQAILALGRQDVDPDSILLPAPLRLLGASSDHLVVEVRDRDISVGDEIAIQLGYAALLRATTSPFVAKVELPPTAALLSPDNQLTVTR